MLFDLKGKRRRVVQATYLTLAVLMGGGLVLFGIGGDVSGGLFDAVRDNPGGRGGGDSLIQDRIGKAEERLRANPRDQVALREYVRSNYQLAANETDQETGAFNDRGKGLLGKAAGGWKRYLALEPDKVDDSLARLMVQAFGPNGLNEPAKAARAAEVVAEADPSSSAFVQVVYYATLADQTRKADLAGRKAVSLAKTKDERNTVRKQVGEAKAAKIAQQAQQQAGQQEQDIDPGGVPAE